MGSAGDRPRLPRLSRCPPHRQGRLRGRCSRSVASVAAVGRECRSGRSGKVSSYESRSSTPDAHDDHTQINAHHHYDPCLSRPRHPRLGRVCSFFSHPALIVLAITLLVLSGVSVFSGGNLSPGVREDRANRWVTGAFGLIGLLAAYLPAYTDRREFWTLDGDAIR